MTQARIHNKSNKTLMFCSGIICSRETEKKRNLNYSSADMLNLRCIPFVEAPPFVTNKASVQTFRCNYTEKEMLAVHAPC